MAIFLLGTWEVYSVECFSIEYRKTKTRVITTNQEKEKYLWEPKRTQSKTSQLRGKTRATKSWLVLVMNLIGWESSGSFQDQSQSKVKQKKINLWLFNLCNTHCDVIWKDYVFDLKAYFTFDCRFRGVSSAFNKISKMKKVDSLHQ